MKIYDDQMFHGAALIQIAEHPQFTAINSLKIGREVVRTAYKVNDEIAVFLKYAKVPNKGFQEYQFTFTTSHLKELISISSANPSTFIALVCIKDREVCCISYEQFSNLVDRRKNAAGKKEPQYVILVTVPKRKSMRVYVNEPGKRGKYLGKQITIHRNDFPEVLFP